MANARKGQSHQRLTIIAIGLMLLVGGIIVFLDRDQVRQLAGKAEWSLLVAVLALVALSYYFTCASMIVMWRVLASALTGFIC